MNALKTRIQIFTDTEGICEVDGYLTGGWDSANGFFSCTVKDLDSGDTTDYIFSTNGLAFVRLWKEKGDN